MKQVVQLLKHGRVEVWDVPTPAIRPGGALVLTHSSLISTGTERAAVDFSRLSLVGKARQRPDLVRQVLNKARRDGLWEAVRTAQSRLDSPMPIGYSCAGVVIETGEQASDFRVGDAVACAGAGYANHAEVNYAPRNLIVPLPLEGQGRHIPFDHASFAAVGAIALHAVRLAGSQIGESAAVIGLGLVGLLIGQILKAQSCRVAGVDPIDSRRALAKLIGFDSVSDPQDAEINCLQVEPAGVDCVFIAAAGKDHGPSHLAAALARDRAKIVAVGAIPLDLPRREYYRKELSLVVSRSYGPGRYDSDYEDHGRDYPVGYVRWTERENMRAFLNLLANGRVNVEPLITHRIPVDSAPSAYEMLSSPDVLSVVIQYPAKTPSLPVSDVITTKIGARSKTATDRKRIGLSLIGAGMFAKDVLLPAVRRMQSVELRGVISAGGLNARFAAEKFGFNYCASEPDDVFSDPATDAVIIATRNDSHAALALRALRAGRAVFVEKPLCVSQEELCDFAKQFSALREEGLQPMLMVGFNRRFAPATAIVKEFFGPETRGLCIQYRINAGKLPDDSWVGAAEQGGGRIVSEMCHFLDLAAYFAAGRPITISATRGATTDDCVIVLEFDNNALATIGFYSGGDRSYSKERVEIFGSSKVAVIEDFRRVWLIKDGKTKRYGHPWSSSDKGHSAEIASFCRAVEGRGGAPLLDDAIRATRLTFAALESLKLNGPVRLEAS